MTNTGITLTPTYLTVQLFPAINNSRLAVVIGIATLIVLILALLASFFSRRSSANLATAETQRQSKQRFRSLVQNASDVIAIVTADGIINYLSPSLKRILGYEPEDWLGKNALELVHPEDLTKANLHRLAHLYSAVHLTTSFRLRHIDGSWRDFEVIVNNLLTPSITGIVATCRDITERKQAEEALSRALKEQESIMEVILDVVYVLDRNGNLLKWNKRLETTTGLSPDALKGKSALAFFPEAEKATIARAIEEVFEKGKAEVEGHLIDKDEVLVPYEWNGVTLKDEEGNIIGMTGIGRDITKRRQAESVLRESEAKFRSLIQNSSDLITIVEPDGTIQYASPSYERILGYLPSELLGKNAFEFIHPEDVSSAFNFFNELRQNAGGISYVEFRFQHKDGSWCFLETTGNNLLANSSVGAIVINSCDITERKKAEAALQQLNTNLERQVQERTAQLQKALDFEAMLKRITDKVRDSLDESQILPTAVEELVLVSGVSCCNTALYNLEQGISTICYEYATSKPAAQARVAQIASFPEVYQQLLQGQYFQFCSIVPNPIRGRVAMLTCPIFDDQGVLGDLWLINDKEHAFNELEIRLVQQVANQCAIAIRQARLYQAATAQVEELEKLNQLKDDFLSTVSHELRTPVTNMKLAIHLLKIAPTTPARERYLEILQNECTREIELINNLLDLQQLEDMSYSKLLEAVSIQDWLPGIIEPFQLRTQERQQILHVDLPPSLPSLLADRVSLGRVLTELLNNAYKYTSPGGEIVLSISHNSCLSGITLDSGQAQGTAPTSAIIFTISNQAEIPAAELPHIFEKFYRVPNTNPWQQSGTGLGLALVQKLVEQMQGTIKIESSKGWTTVTVQLPNDSRNGVMG